MEAKKTLYRNDVFNITLNVDLSKENLRLAVYHTVRHHFEDVFYSILEMHELEPLKAVRVENYGRNNSSIYLTGDNGTMELKELTNNIVNI